jgi:hypothetical protein
MGAGMAFLLLDQIDEQKSKLMHGYAFGMV